VQKGSAAVAQPSADPGPDRLCLLSSAVRDEPAQVVAERARDAGFSAIEWGIGPGQAATATRGEAAKLAQLSVFNGLDVAGVCVQGGPASLDKPASIKTVAAFAAELGAPFVRVWAPAFAGGSLAAAQKQARASLAKAVEITARAGVVLLVENAPDSIAPSTTLVRELIEAHEPEQVGVLWDPGNGLMEGHLDASLAIAELGAYLQHVHVKNIVWRRTDGVWKWSYSSLATGLLDWPATLAALRAAGYGGRVSLDHLSGAATVAGLRRERKALHVLVDAAWATRAKPSKR
jgi:sugar phosphate isomerase/epimerase